MDKKVVLRQVFAKYDGDGDGFLSYEDFLKLIHALSLHIPELKGFEENTVRGVFELMDINHDGKLSYSEYERWWLMPQKYSYFMGGKANLLRKAYNLFHQYVQYDEETAERAMTLEQFQRMMFRLGIPFTEDMFDAIDTDEDGLVDFGEFCQWLNWF